MLYQATLLLSSLLLSAAATPVDVVVPRRRDVELIAPPTPRSAVVKRDTNATFDMGWQAKNEMLFSGSWPVSASNTLSLSMLCIDCRTYGSLVATTTMPDDFGEFFDELSDFDLFNNATLSVGFSGVGAHMELGLTAGMEGVFAMPLFQTMSPIGVAAPDFQVGVVFFVELVASITGKVETSGGFEVTIPDGSEFTMPLDPTVPNTANFDGSSVSLLPLAVTGTSANVTLALRLRVQAGIDIPDIGAFDARALAGAYLNIPEFKFGAALGTSPGAQNGSAVVDVDACTPAFADFNINAGVFVDVGADVANVAVADFNPKASTTLFGAAASTCFSGLQEATAGAGAALGGGSRTTEAPACPTAMITETLTTTATYAMTSCAVPVINCPGNMTQVVEVGSPTVVTTSSCPVNVTTTSAPASVSAPASATATATASAVAGSSSSSSCAESAPSSPPAAGAMALTRLATPVTQTLAVDPAAMAPAAPSITGSVGGAGSSGSGSISSSISSSPVSSVPEGAGSSKAAVTTTVLSAAYTTVTAGSS